MTFAIFIGSRVTLILILPPDETGQSYPILFKMKSIFLNKNKTPHNRAVRSLFFNSHSLRFHGKEK